MPPEVVARLDRVLADLRTDDRARSHRPEAGVPLPHDDGATVVPLERRRRSRFAKLVLAAAAVVAVGYGVGQVATGTLSGSGSDSDAGSVADRSTHAESGGGQRVRLTRPSPAPRGTPRSTTSASPVSSRSTPTARPTRSPRSATSQPTGSTPPAGGRSLDICGPRRTPAGARLVPATYDGRPTLVLFRAPQGGSQRVDLYLCDGPTPRAAFRTVTLDGE